MSAATPQQRASVDRAMATMEAKADMWAEEVGLARQIEMLAAIADKLPKDPEARAHFLGRLKDMIAKWVSQAFIEGFDLGQDGRKQYERERLATTLRLIQAQAGHPDAAEGCRVIIATAEAAIRRGPS